MIMAMFEASDKAKSDTENIRGLTLEAAKLTTVQATKLPLWHKLNKIGMADGTLKYSYIVKGTFFNIVIRVRYVCKKDKAIPITGRGGP
jgi:hypothetical protein